MVTSKTPDPTSAMPAEAPFTRVRRLRGISLLHTPILPGLFWTLLRQPRHTIYHLHVAQAGLPEITYLAAKLRHRPFIAHIHLDVEPSGQIGKLVLGPYKRIILKFVLTHANKVVVLSPDQATLMAKKYGIDPGRIIVLPNGVAPDYFLPARQDFHTPVRLLFVGRLAIQKRPERIVEAMENLENAHLDVVGDGPDKAKLEAYARSHNLQNVTFHGIKRGTELRNFYREADVLVLPSDKEGMPLTLLEAMASALPVVGSDVLGIRELIQNTGVLVQDPSAATFAKTIRNVIASPQRLKQLSASSRKAAEAYSWTRLTGQVRDLYREVTS